ncbi:MAG: type IV pili methyl-accepting chemotaxis transducer N-terminal domain-containing protein [Pseudomonadota bacterium]
MFKLEPNHPTTRRTSILTSAICLSLAFTAPGVGMFGATEAEAQTADTEAVGGKARVSRSASLRTLTETIASASCRIGNGYNAELAQLELQAARSDFDQILNGLINGNNALGMPGPEERRRTLQELNQTAALWAPIDAAAVQLAAGLGSDADASVVREGYPALYTQTEQMASVVSGQYADPQQLLQSDATVLNFAVRQRALAYSMTRAMCELAAGTGDADTQEELATSVDLFDRTLIALRDGFPAAGINPPPNDTIRDRLSETYLLWTAQKSVFDQALAGQTPDANVVVSSAAFSSELSREMNNIITLFLIAAPGQDDVYRIPLEAYATDELAGWMTNPELIAAINAQNDAHAGLNEDGIIALDQQWRAEEGEGGGELINRLMSEPMSVWLADKQAGTAGFVTEVFVMDNKGLNVAQSAVTSDYWQGDEAKWQQTYSVGPDAMHISEVEFDDSTGFYQSQASMAVTDPATGEVIGAVTFGINVQSLM